MEPVAELTLSLLTTKILFPYILTFPLFVSSDVWFPELEWLPI